MPNIELDERTRKLIEASQDPNEIAQLCIKAGIASGSLIQNSVGEVVVNVAKPTVRPNRRLNVDDRSADLDKWNLPPEFLEYRK